MKANNPRTLSELINKDETWNMHDLINFKSVNSPKTYYIIKKKHKNKTIKHIQPL